MGLQINRSSKEPMSEINVTPFVDVMLVLLIIFMVTAPLLTVGVQVDLPETSADTLSEESEPLTLTINSKLSFSLCTGKIIDNSIPVVLGVLEVPEINLKQYITEGTSDDNLQLGPGRYLSSSLPGEFSSNVAIAGHRTTYGAPFKDLDSLNIGDKIILTYASKKYVYIVDETRIVESDSGEYVLYNRGVDRITLTTCHPKYSAKQRLIVSGVLKTIEN